MTKKTLAAYTEVKPSHGDYPAFVNISEQDGEIVVTQRACQPNATGVVLLNTQLHMSRREFAKFIASIMGEIDDDLLEMINEESW